jgi:short subunit dehydrogenase
VDFYSLEQFLIGDHPVIGRYVRSLVSGPDQGPGRLAKQLTNLRKDAGCHLPPAPRTTALPMPPRRPLTLNARSRSKSTARKRPIEKKHQGAMQAGARRYPEPPFPKQHHAKPGTESDLDLKPMYDAPHYKGSEKLSGKVALITGGDSGIGRAVAVLFAREGADIAVAYLTEHDDAEETKKAVENEGRRCITISGDVADPRFCTEAVERTRKRLGDLDILVNNAAFQEHVNDFEDLTDAHFDRTLKTNLYGYFHMAKAAVPHMKPGSAIVMTGPSCSSYITGEILPIIGGYSGG